MPRLGFRWGRVNGVAVRLIPVKSFSKWIVFYSIDDPDTLRNIRLLHSAMNIRRLLRQP
jgi:hypothetical protein